MTNKNMSNDKVMVDMATDAQGTGLPYPDYEKQITDLRNEIKQL